MIGSRARAALLDRMRETLDTHGGRTAIRTYTARMSYREFGRLVGGLTQELQRERGGVGLLLDRSATAYAAMWASVAVGRPYVPLNPREPPNWLRSIAQQAKVTTVICTESSRDAASALDVARDDIVEAERLTHSNDWATSDRDDRVAYICFTSGSTGKPKGVPISYENLGAFINNVEALVDYRSDDVCSQFNEISFDMSVQDIYLALLKGAAICPASQTDIFNPARYVARNEVTVWSSVPSLAQLALRHNSLRALQDCLATLRLSNFNGEVLTSAIARGWRAATSGEILNSYGPTEATVAVSTQRWVDQPATEEAGAVSIGTVFPDCKVALLDDGSTTAVADGGSRTGELLLAGPQVFEGYLDANLPSPFTTVDGTKYYRTGDHVLARAGRLYFLGRADWQVKIRGYRIEILEVEHHIQRHLGSQALAVVPFPRRQPTALVLYLAGDHEPPGLADVWLDIPHYMRPRRVVLVDALPLTAHGKLDRDALIKRLEAGT